MLGLAFILSALAIVQASPSLTKRQSVTTLTTAQVDSYTPYTWYASTAYCNPTNTLAWNCGANCQANPSFEPIASGGDGSDVQFWYVGYDPSLKTIIVAHQGTDPSQFEADLTDADFSLATLSTSLFPGISSSIECHNGFASAQASTATSILAAVQSGMSKYGATKVTMVGHSLGAAISLIDSVYLPLHLPSGTTFQTILYGLPRVGNPAFADYIDANTNLVGHVNNLYDPIPIVPGRSLGFAHPSHEVHIVTGLSWDACPGQDSTDAQCIIAYVPNIFDGDLSDHDGPYNGVTMGC